MTIRGRSCKQAPRGGPLWRFPGYGGIQTPPENGRVTSEPGVYEIGGIPVDVHA